MVNAQAALVPGAAAVYVTSSADEDRTNSTHRLEYVATLPRIRTDFTERLALAVDRASAADRPAEHTSSGLRRWSSDSGAERPALAIEVAAAR
jgi:hypothetical protein